jgi:hypothetical protein
VTKDGGAGRDDAKLDPLQASRFGELRRQTFEKGRQQYRDMEVIARPPVQLQRSDKPAQHTAQSGRRVRGPRQFLALFVTIKDLPEDVVCAGDDLQGLAQVVTGHRQQGHAEVVLPSRGAGCASDTDPWFGVDPAGQLVIVPSMLGQRRATGCHHAERASRQG